MHCPQCGQRTTSDVARFCKHCGFALDAVKDLLTPSRLNQDPPGLLNIRVGADPRSLRGLNQAAYLLLFAFVPVVLAVAQGVFGFNLLPPLLLIKAFFVLLAVAGLRFGYAVYEAKQVLKPATKSQMATEQRELELDQPDSENGMALGAQRVNTAKIIQPPSITEHTTKLLGKSEDDK
jgi:hypothetical protein